MADGPDERVIMLVKQSRALSMAKRFNVAGHIAQVALEVAQEAAPSQVSLASAAVGLNLQLSGNQTAAVPILLEAASQLGEQGEVAAQAEALHTAATANVRLVQLDAAASLYDQAHELARDCNDESLQVKTLLGIGMVEQLRWNLARAREYLESARKRAETQNLAHERLLCTNELAKVLWHQGRYDQVIQLGAESSQLAMVAGKTAILVASISLTADALKEVGRPSQAAQLIEDTLATYTSHVEPFARQFLKITLAETLILGNDPNDPRIHALIEDARSTAGERLFLALSCALVELERRVQPDVREPHEPAWEQYKEIQGRIGKDFERRLQFRADIAWVEGLLKDGKVDQAIELIPGIIAFCEKNQLPDGAARACAVAVLAHRHRDEHTEAEEARQRGLEYLDQAANKIDDLEMRQGFRDRAIFRALTAEPKVRPGQDEDRLLAIYGMIHALNSETDPEAVLESMLDMALDVVGAERGMILLRDPSGEFGVRLARNLEKETVRDAAEFSRNVVRSAGATGKAVLSIDTGHDERLRDFKSVSMYGIRSVICVPLRSRGQLIGAVYLDNRKEGALFSEEELHFLEAFADHAALALENAQIRTDLERENRRLQIAAETRVQYANMIGRSAPMQHVFDLIERIADTNLPVLIHGESGTGKELVARAIHFNGPRRKRPFLTENCAAVAESLLESELFGHVRGAFTGADRDRQGLFEQADRGSLFLDEVGDMSPGMQARLLRVLQEGDLRRVGGNDSIHVDVRVIAATHRDLRRRVEEGTFREDLLYRLQVLSIELPPLRDRHGDVTFLIEHFLEQIGKARGRSPARVRRPVMDLLERYSWPGNVRQLESTLQRLVLLAGDEPITIDVVSSDPDLRVNLLGESTPTEPIYSLEVNEKQQIQAALEETGGNRTRAAKLLGISRATIFRKIKEYGLS